jgi:hypothetical protein
VVFAILQFCFFRRWLVNGEALLSNFWTTRPCLVSDCLNDGNKPVDVGYMLINSKQQQQQLLLLCVCDVFFVSRETNDPRFLFFFILFFGFSILATNEPYLNTNFKFEI